VATEKLPNESFSTDKSYLDKAVSLEATMEFEHLNRVMNEALRFECPASSATGVTLLEDVQLGKYHFKKGDVILNFLHGVHHNENEWQRPYEFIPERFDHTSKLSLNSEGKKRSPASFIPFNGGMRVCMGKTFAEANLKVFLTYLTQSFNFEHVDPIFQAGEFPYAHFLQSAAKPILIKLTLNQ